jgi:hypothetical protein
MVAAMNKLQKYNYKLSNFHDPDNNDIDILAILND